MNLQRTGLHAAWWVLALLTLGLVSASVPARYDELRAVSPEASVPNGELLPADALALAQLNLSPTFYAAYFTVLEAGTALAFLGMAAFLYWRRSASALVVLVSLTLMTFFGSSSSPLSQPLVAAQPAWATVLQLLRAVGVGGFIVIYYVLPNGRFVPGWTRWLAVVWFAYVGAALFLPVLRIPAALLPANGAERLALIWALLWLFSAAAAQVYRYRRVSNPAQRQQTRWVVFGLVVTFAVMLAAVLPLQLSAALRVPGVRNMAFRFAAYTAILAAFLFFAFTLALSLLRHRLFDIDFVIRRTLVYGVLTGALAAVYFGTVLLLQGLFRALSGGAAQSQLAVVGSTLAIAALFNPLRRRVQGLIDRRFYRRKYNATQTLAAFAAAARDETDLERLSAQLVGVVDETVQPEHVSLWLAAGPGRPASDISYD